MTQYLATFYTHLAAMRTQRALAALGVDARMEPVPRALSASCGVCVRYKADEPREGCLHRDFEALYAMEGAAYRRVKSNDAPV